MAPTRAKPPAAAHITKDNPTLPEYLSTPVGDTKMPVPTTILTISVIPSNNPSVFLGVVSFPSSLSLAMDSLQILSISKMIKNRGYYLYQKHPNGV